MKPIAIIVALLFGLVHSQYTDDTCGLRPLKLDDEDYLRIVGGNESLRGDWPWACSMRRSGNHICGGSLINREWIVTAAHCVSGSDPSIYTWACGLHDRLRSDNWTRIYTSDLFVVHPDYNSSYIQNDIALFKISSPAVYTKYILPACFPAKTDTYAGQMSIATGWGSTSSGGSLATYQMEVAMPVLTDARCTERFDDGKGNLLKPATQVCAGEVGQNKDTCQGDSGGPLVVKHADGLWRLIGLTSWGYGCGDGGVYARTSGFRDWVESYTGPLPTGKGK